MLVVDLITGIAGFILIMAPFLFGFYDNSAATWLSIATGMMLFINSCRLGMKRFDYDEDEELDATEQE